MRGAGGDPFIMATRRRAMLPMTTPPPDDDKRIEPAAPHRAVRSFVVRAGRMTTAQERAWIELWPRYGVPTGDAPLDLAAVFGRDAPRTLEIGFGNGESLVALAAAHPDRDYLGVEVHRPGVGHLMLRAEELGLANVRAVSRDAVEVLQQCIPAASLDEVLLYFPDPWPKKRHHKRRIVQPGFVALVANRLRAGGVLRMATDWQPYAEHMLEVASGCQQLRNASATGDFVPRPDSRPVTRFERRGQRLGHGVWDLAFTRS
jgi:tRNA (guanine-N7-)-methyltransferase